MRIPQFVNRVMVMLMALVQVWHMCQADCLEHEREALLQLKPHFHSKRMSYYNWGSDSNCCDWPGVLCADPSGGVTGIDLPSVLDRSVNQDWHLNASLFLPFQNLRFLDLSDNYIVSCVENHGFEKLKHSRLRYVYLNNNNFNNSVISSLNGLQFLENLELSSNRLKGKISIQEMNNLPSLRRLNMDNNEIEGFESFDGPESSLILSNLEELTLTYNRFRNNSLSILHNCSSLTLLTLSGNRIDGSLNLNGLPFLTELRLNNVTEYGLQIVGASSYLHTIQMSQNKFKGPIFSGYLNNLTNVKALNMENSFLDELALKSLEYLWSLESLSISILDDTKLAQGLPHLKNLKTLELRYSSIILNNSLQHIGLCNLNRLQKLNLYDSDLKGSLPMCLGNLTYLESLRLESNHLQVPISLSPLLNNSKLTNLEIRDVEIYEDHMELQSLIPRFQLQVLELSGHGSASSFPKFLYHQSSLSRMSIENIQIRGEFPYWLLDNNTNLQSLRLIGLSLGGPLRLPMHPRRSLLDLDISNNRFEGHIPQHLGNYLSLSNLNMSRNNFVGDIPASVTSMSSLMTFDLSNNGFSGQMPSGFCPSGQFHVFLSNNKIQRLPTDSLLNCSTIVSLDLSYNSLTGGIPRAISELSSLSFLLLGHNYLSGGIPLEFCKLKHLQLTDLSNNNLSGHIPSCLSYITNSALMMYPYGRDLSITTKGRSLLFNVLTFTQFHGIDLSCNNFTGKIPLELGNLTSVLSLNLSHNNLTGLIPSTFSKFRRIMSLDLSYNKLHGSIPRELTQLTFLSSFSVAHNNLSGKTPGMVGQFATFEASNFEGNPFLCGFPLSKSCTPPPPPLPNGSNNDEDDDGFMDMTAFYASFCSSCGVVLLAMVAVLSINLNWRRSWFHIIEVVINKTYYFFVDKLLFPFGIKALQPLV